MNNESNFSHSSSSNWINQELHLEECDLNLSVMKRRYSYQQCNQNLNSSASHSFEHTIPRDNNKSSQIEDQYWRQEQQYKQNQIQKIRELVPQQVQNIIDFSHADGLDLQKLVFIGNSHQKMKDENKNILRNFGNAQKYYTLNHQKARERIQLNLQNPSQFDHWVQNLKLQSFGDFKKVWKCKRSRLFTRLYRQICWQFYAQNAIPFVFNSRIKKKETKVVHLQQIYTFLKGIRNPNDFTAFKSTW